MESITKELEKNGIKIICPINTFNVNEIATYVARLLYSKFPELKIDYAATFSKISRLPMYIAEMPYGMSDACYFYKNESLYFRKGLSFDTIKKLAFHELLHHFQEIKDSYGKLHRLGLCTYTNLSAYGNALNEASVQLMSAYATGEKKDTVKYYGVTFPTDSPTYYPMLCNLVKQIGYACGFSLLFESTFYANDAFFDKFKECFGEKTAFKIQQNFEKLMMTEEKIIKLNSKIQTEDMSYIKFKKASDTVTKYKDDIKNTFLATQNLIVTSFFEIKMKAIVNANDVEETRKYLYSFTNLIGMSDGYTFFNDFYVKTISELDARYEQITNPAVPIVVKKSAFSHIIESLKRIFTLNKANEKESSHI